QPRHECRAIGKVELEIEVRTPEAKRPRRRQRSRSRGGRGGGHRGGHGREAFARRAAAEIGQARGPRPAPSRRKGKHARWSEETRQLNAAPAERSSGSLVSTSRSQPSSSILIVSMAMALALASRSGTAVNSL